MLVMATLLAMSAPAAAATQHWHDWGAWAVVGGGDADIVSPGVLRLRTSRDEVTKAIHDTPVPSTYTLRFRQRITSYGHEQGMQVYDGAHRMMLYFRPTGIAARRVDNTVATIVPWDRDTEWHDYRVVVEHGTADLYVDGAFRARWPMHRHTGPDQVQHWVKGAATAGLEVDSTRMDATGYALADDWANAAAWTKSGTGAASAAGVLHLATSADEVTQVYREPWIPSSYTVHFRQRVVSYGTEQGFVAYDGAHRAMLYFRTGGIYVRQKDNTVLRLMAWDADTSWHDYRVEVGNGRGRLYVDGVHRGEWRLHAHSRGDKIEHWVKGPDPAYILVDDTKLEYAAAPSYGYFDDFEDEPVGADPSHWMETNLDDTWEGNDWSVTTHGGDRVYRRPRLIADGGHALLHVMAKNATFAGSFRVNGTGDDARIYLNLRRNDEEARVVVRYTAYDQRWRIMEREARNEPVRYLAATAPGAVPVGSGWHRFEVRAYEGSVYFYLDGALVLSTHDVRHRNYGRVGFQVKRVDVSLDDVTYVGDAPVNPGVREIAIAPERDNVATFDLVELPNGDLLAAATPLCWRSTDGGRSWRVTTAVPCSKNMLVLPSGELLVIKTEGDRDRADVYADNGTRLVSSRFIHDAPKNRITMPDRLTLADDGTIFYASGESGHAEEEYGGVWIYRSADGRAWTRATTLHEWGTWTPPFNLQEGQVADSGGGVLRAYFRTHLGYLLESISTDGGDRWSAPIPTPLRSPQNSFATARDAATDTLYMVWTYDDTDEVGGSNPPRERLALAASRDGGRTWLYAMDLDDWEGHRYRHMNCAAEVIDRKLWIMVARRVVNGSSWEPQEFKLRMWSIDLDTIETSPVFPGTH